MGASGEGPFENDTSMDWVHELRESEDPDYPLGVLRELDGLGPLDTRAAELGIAAAEAVAASRGTAGKSPADVLEWLRASGARADDAVAELALRVVDAIEADSELCAVWMKRRVAVARGDRRPPVRLRAGRYPPTAQLGKFLLST